MQTEVETALDWGAALREVAAGGSVIEGEGVVTGVGEVASPDVKGEKTEVGCDVSTKEGVCLLAEGVGLVPIGLTCEGGVGPDGEGAQSAGEVEAVIQRGGGGVSGNEGDVVAGIGDDGGGTAVSTPRRGAAGSGGGRAGSRAA